MDNIIILEEFLEKYKTFNNVEILYYELDALENLIQDYKELKEKQKELYSENLKLNSEIASSVYWLSTPTKDIENQFIPKSKVKEKIEELEKDVNDFEEYWSKDPRKFKKQKSTDYYKLEALKELLEEGE